MDVPKRDYYQALGVSKTADTGEIKKAFKRLAKECHPDLNPGDQLAEDRFKEIAEAHEVLTNGERRALYDQYGHAGPRQAGFSGFAGMGIEDILGQFADMFGGLGFGFGSGGRRSRVQQGNDLQTEMTITFAEAARGCDKPLELERAVHCDTCGGSGGRPGTAPVPCGTCGGRGQVAMRQGFLTIASDCPTCRGRGRVLKDKCESCRGAGVSAKAETVDVHVPAGIDEGQTLRVPGKGEAGPAGGAPGHLYVTFHVEPDARFQRSGDDLVTRVALTYAQAALGARVRVPTLDDDAEVEVRAGTQPGTVQVLRGRGMPNVHGRGHGDLAVQFTVSVPKKLSAEERRLLEELQRLAPEPEAAPAASAAQEEDDGGGFPFFRRGKKKKA